MRINNFDPIGEAHFSVILLLGLSSKSIARDNPFYV